MPRPNDTTSDPDIARLYTRMDSLDRTVSEGLERVAANVNDLRQDIKQVREENLPYRVSTLEEELSTLRSEGIPKRLSAMEKWRDALTKHARWVVGALLVGIATAAVGAWIAAI